MEGEDRFPQSSFPFASFLGFGAGRSTISSILRERDMFNVSNFSAPFESVFDSAHSVDSKRPTSSNVIIIEELNSDNDGAVENVHDQSVVNHSSSNVEPFIEHPPDNTVLMAKQNAIEEKKSVKDQSFAYKKVTFGGVNGTYYTSSMTRNMGSDGVILEEMKEADATTGRAAHRISRGLNDRGHSVTRKLGSDGKVDTLQTLHNLEKDELPGFERAWAGNAEKHLDGWKDGPDAHVNSGRDGGSVGQPSWDGWPFSSMGRFDESRQSSRGGPKKVVTIKIE